MISKLKENKIKILFQELSTLPELNLINEFILEKLSSAVSPLNNTTKYLFQLGGKRLRPILCILIAHCFAKDFNQTALVKIASIIELIHTASLLHDDIIDHSETRRSHPSAYAKFGLSYSLLAGNFLYTKAFSLCADLKKESVPIIENACLNLIEGEAIEECHIQKNCELETTLQIAKLKTAALFKLCCQLTAENFLNNNYIISSLGNFGENLGIAFQIFDDILDLNTGSHGKPQGKDILERKPSIINTLWLNSGSKLSQHLLTPPKENEEEFFLPQAIAEIKETSILSEAQKIGMQYTQKALENLEIAQKEAEYVSVDFYNKLYKLTEASALRTK